MSTQHIMSQLLTEEAKAAIQVFMPGKTIGGIVIASSTSRILVQLPGGVTGIVTKKEATGFGVTTDDYEAGTPIEAMVIQSENEQGLVLMSLRRASQEMVWAELNECFEQTRIIKVKVTDANKGGLMTLYKGIKAFLPVSQLTPLNYPRVDGADSGEILRRLQSHIGNEMAVRVINADRERGKLIVSEKAAISEKQEETLKSINVGDVVTGQVCGIVKFGIFVTFGGAEGLVHLSELDWGHVSDPGKKFDLGQKVEVLVLGVEGKKLSFSIKRLTDDPWKNQVKEFAAGQKVSGRVVRWNSNGIFIAVNENVNGLFPLEDYGVSSHSELRVREGETRTGEILKVDYDSHRLILKEDGVTAPVETAEEAE
jgi:small subunit ribosomal protein S1